MKKYDLLAGASQKAVTPPIGLAMAGWAKRAAGDNLAHYIHDDIHVKALYVQGRNCAWVLISAEVGSVDPVTTAKIRQRVSSEINLSPAAILVCATHCHSAPILSPVALACTTEEFKNNSVDGKNGSAKSSWDLDAPVKPGVAYTGAINSEWKEMFINTFDFSAENSGDVFMV